LPVRSSKQRFGWLWQMVLSHSGKELGVSITLEQSESLSVIRLEEVVGIASATELKELLLKALSFGKEVRLAVDKATELDVTAVELLWAAAREARKTGVGFALSGQAPEAISAALADAGIELFQAFQEAGQA
jgi:anti-anti-sigma regulatory factor